VANNVHSVHFRETQQTQRNSAKVAVQSKIRVHLSLAILATEIHQFTTRKLPVLGQEIAISGTESYQFRTRKLPVFHSFARLLRSCMKTGGEKVHVTMPHVQSKLVNSRHLAFCTKTRDVLGESP